MTKPRQPFSIGRFLLLVAPQAALLAFLFQLIWPGFWTRQMGAGWGQFILVFLSGEMFLCFFEWGFHRYVLHATIHPWLVRFSRGHRHHHDLTPIELGQPAGPDGWFILNEYPITKEEQYEDAAFPIYAVSAFWALFTPLLLFIQWLLPQVPIMLGGYCAILCSMIGYEVFHAIEHYPYEWWKRAVEDKHFGTIWKMLYGFHHFHHANIKANEAISGFFGLPVADVVFKTYHQPKELLLQDRIAKAKDFKVPDPWPFVRWLDKKARALDSRHTHRT